MVKQIVWTKKAQSELTVILEYWIERNKPTSFSKRLNLLMIAEWIIWFKRVTIK